MFGIGWARDQLIAGKKVRREIWGVRYLFRDAEGVLVFVDVGKVDPWVVQQEDVMAMDWMLA